jgi:hypothetical protein
VNHPREQLIVVLMGYRISAIMKHGCTDGYCRIRRREGMHTNGGCNCYTALAELGLEMAANADAIKRRCDLKPVTMSEAEIERELANG